MSHLHKIYEALQQTSGPAEFARRALDALEIRCDPGAAAIAGIPPVGRTLFVANHPFGALDGLIAIAVLGEVRPDLRLLGSLELAMIPELAPVVLGTDSFSGGDRTQKNAQSLRQALRWLEGEHALLTFPAGEAANFDARARCVTDPPWSPIAGRLVRLSGAQVVPVHFSGENSRWFHLAGAIVPRLRTLLLPRELQRKRGSRIDVQIGAPIPAARLARFQDNEAIAIHLRLKNFLLPASTPARTVPPAHAEHTHEPLADEMPAGALAIEVAALPPANLLVEQGELQVYIADAKQIPHTLSEIGRLRELTSRAAGGGTGRARHLDRFDRYYEHLFVWQPARQQVVGAFRIARTDVIGARRGKSGLHTSKLFGFRGPFFRLLGPALELGRPFVRLEYQQSVLVLMLLWKGIGEIVAREPRYCRLIGPVNVGANYSETSQHLLVDFLRTHCVDRLLASLVSARSPLAHTRPLKMLSTELAMLSHVKPLSALIEDIETDGKGVPKLLCQQLKLGGRVLGFNAGSELGRSIDCLFTVDLRHTKPSALRKFFSESAIARFENAHGRNDVRPAW